jgi:anti-anti-sigma factor
MQLEIIQKTDALIRLALKGRLDAAGVDQVGTRLNAALSGGGHGVVDISQVTFLASLGVRLLLTAAKSLDRRGSKLVLVAPQSLVEQALQHSSLDQLIPVVPDVDRALALLEA